MSREIAEILRSHAEEGDNMETAEEALAEIKEVVAMEKGKGIGGSETLQ